MEYKYKKPEKMNFQEFTEDFIPAFDQVDEVARQKALSINIWAYGGICNPTNGTSPWGAVYETPSPTCNPT